MRSGLFLILFSLSVWILPAQKVQTHAGLQYTGSGSYTGDRNNKRDSVLFSAPMGIEVDTAGRIYVSNEHNIFWIKDNTAFLAVGYALDPNEPGAADSKDFAGSAARFARPAGLAINPNTNELMVADLDNNQIRKVEKFFNTQTQQIVQTYAGVKLLNGDHLDGTRGSAKFNGPTGIAVASNGDIYVADRNNHCIRKISGNNVTTIAGSAGNPGHVNATGTAAKFAAPYNVFIDGNNLLVADYGNSAIRKVDLTSGAVTDLITSGLFGPKDLCKVGTQLFIVEELCVKVYDQSTLSIYAGSSSQQGYVNDDGTKARFANLTGIVYHNKENLLYVVDMGNNVVRTISPDPRPVCNFSVSTTTATKGQTIILQSTSQNFPDQFKWTITPATYSLLSGTTLTDSVIYVSMNQIGTYSVKLWVANNSGADSLLKSNHIAISSNTAKPVAEFTASNTIPEVDEIISLIDLSTNTPTSWTWRISPPDFIWMNGTDSNSRIPNVKFTNGDNFTVTLIATNVEGSGSITKTDYIKVNGTSIQTLKKESIVLYPNPSSDFVNMNVPEDAKLEILSINGSILTTLDVQAGDYLSIPVAEFKPGFYFVRISGLKTVYSGRFVVQH